MIIGIDLGTTNSAAAVWRDGAATLIPNALGDLLTPSAVSIDTSGTTLVGAAARDREASHPEATASSFKRLMGTREVRRLGTRDLSPEDLSALVLMSLKADAETALGEPVSEAVITVPAYFNDRQRKATRRAGELAGLTVRRLLNEPTAAALAYGLHDRGEKEPFLVFDLGGGTFDVSIVEIFDGIVEVRASAGDNRLGGDDFNEVLVALAAPRLLPAGILDKADPLRRREILRAAAERTRRALSEHASAAFDVAIDGVAARSEVTAAEFEAAAEPLLAKLRDPVLRSLRDSGIHAETLSEIVLAGGGTRMPIVRRAITRMFGRFPNTTVHPDHAIALGAAVQAGLMAREIDLAEVRLTDVCPFTLGVDHAVRDARGNIRAGLFSPIISRNTVVPVSRVEHYVTTADNQRHVEFGVFQGEAREVSGNVRLGSVKVPVPPRAAGTVTVDCRFSYDSSGLLEVDVSVPETGVTRNLVIVDEDDAPDDRDIARRRAALAALKVHPREEAANRATLARGERCYESFTGPARDQIGQWLVQFETILAAQEPHAIETARTQLEAALDEIEGERFPVMRRDVWRTLGIARTTDLGAIRKAYANALRAMDPDSDPDGFARLRAARDQALAQARTAVPDDEPADRTESPAVSRLGIGTLAAPAIVADAVGTIEVAGAGSSGPPLTEARADRGIGASLALPETGLALPVIDAAAGDVAILITPPFAAYDDGYSEVLRTLHGARDTDELDANETTRLQEVIAFLLADERMARLTFAAESERWFSEVLADAIPRSDPVLAVAATHFGWLQRSGSLGLSPPAERVAERARSLAYAGEASRPGHADHALWAELTKPLDTRSRRNWLIRKARMRTYLATIRRTYPDAEEYFDPARVALWDRTAGGSGVGLSGPSWSAWSIGILVLIRLCTMFVQQPGGDTPAPPPPRYVAAAATALTNRDANLNLALLSFADGLTLDRVHRANPALEADLADLWQDAARRGVAIDGFLTEVGEFLVRRFNNGFAHADYDALVEWLRADLDELVARRSLGEIACGEWLDDSHHASDRTRDEAQFRRRIMARIILADRSSPGRRGPARTTYPIPGAVMARLGRETGLDRAGLVKALDGGGAPNMRCKVRQALLTAALDLPRATALPILRGM